VSNGEASRLGAGKQIVCRKEAKERLSITEVPVLPIRASRHLAAWVVWQTTRVSLVDDLPAAAPIKQRRRSTRPRRRRLTA
jgi:hypothetical protein